jgi:hypothetical protein
MRESSVLVEVGEFFHFLLGDFLNFLNLELFDELLLLVHVLNKDRGTLLRKF